VWARFTGFFVINSTQFGVSKWAPKMHIGNVPVDRRSPHFLPTWGFSQQQRCQQNPMAWISWSFFRATVGTKTTINHLAPPLPYRSIMFVQTHWRSMKKKRYTMIYISQHIWKTPDHIPPRQIILHLYDLWWFDFFALFVGLVLSPAECVSSGNSSDPSWFTENSIMDDPYPVIPNSNR